MPCKIILSFSFKKIVNTFSGDIYINYIYPIHLHTTSIHVGNYCFSFL